MSDLDEDYVDESFEDDSDESDIEEQEEEEEQEESQNKNNAEEEDSDDVDNQDDSDDDDDSATLEDSEDAEADPKVEFLLGNVSQETVPPSPQKLTIKEISLDTKTNALSHPQPHARRQLLRAFNRKLADQSSSSDEESQVVITKTVAEVNSLALGRETSLEESPDSGRTLKPGSSRAKEDLDSSESDEEVDDEEEEDKMKYGDDIEILEEDEEDGEEEEVEDQEEDSESDCAVDSDEENQQLPDELNKDGHGTDVEVDQLELEEDEQAHHDPEPKADNVIILEDASDNSSEYSTQFPLKDSHQGYETDITLIDDEIPSQLSLEAKLETSTEIEVATETKIENVTKIKTDTKKKTEPVIEAQNMNDVLNAEQIAAAMPPMSQMEQFISEMNRSVTDGSFVTTPDMATVKLLERQMSQMSAMIMKTLRMNAGAANNRGLEQSSMPTKKLRERTSNVQDPGVEGSTTGSSRASARSYDSGNTREKKWTNGMDPYGYDENASSVGSRTHCRCPSTTDFVESDPEPDTVRDAAFYMDECGQGDGLMRHPRQRRPPDYQNSLCSAPPSSYTIDGCARSSNVSRSRSSNEKINYKNLGRKSFSFTNTQMREIERQNQILLRKMMTVKPTAPIKASTSSIKCNTNTTSKPQPPAPTRLTSAAINRKKFQRQIDLENDLIKRKLDAIHTRRPMFK